jgi:YhcH/YjgK/YiaL family protein
MIKDRIENIGNYTINQYFEELKNFITQNANDRDALLKVQPPYKAIPLEYTTKDFNMALFEGHRKFIDIHYVLEGTEEIGITQIEAVKPNMDYNAEGDYQLFDGQVHERVTLAAGEFLILYPHETHVTAGIINGNATDVKKIVFKCILNENV